MVFSIERWKAEAPLLTPNVKRLY